MLDGKVRDTFEISHAVTGMQVGTVRVTATGQLKCNWVWEV
jgi:hypothetical protein